MGSRVVEECNQETQRALKDAFTAAQDYLQHEPDGEVTKDILLAYGFTANENINLTVVNGSLNELSMSASFNFPGTMDFLIDSSGRVSRAQ